MRLSKANQRLLKEFQEVAAVEDKKKKAPKKAKRIHSPGEEIHKAKALVTSKASRGFTTKRPVKATLSYPL